MTEAVQARPREVLAASRRLVVKVGSSLLADLSRGLARERIQALADQVAALHAQDRDVVIVSSGAVAAGAARLGLRAPPASLERMQAAAAVGQGRLMQAYAEAFERHGIAVGQMLLTRDGFDDRVRYLNARNTLNALLAQGTVPVVNENDTVMVEEIRFGDNDELSALVAALAEADALVILSDVDGLHARAPAEGQSPVIDTVECITPTVEAMAGASDGPLGRGGMSSKLRAAKRATAAGITVVVAPGRDDEVLTRLCGGEKLGTCFVAQPGALRAKKQWLAARRAVKAIRVDVGARRAVVERGKSLLAIGVTGADPDIAEGESVRLLDSRGEEFARGISNFSGPELARIAGRRGEELASILGYACATTVVHRDNLVLTEA